MPRQGKAKHYSLCNIYMDFDVLLTYGTNQAEKVVPRRRGSCIRRSGFDVHHSACISDIPSSRLSQSLVRCPDGSTDI